MIRVIKSGFFSTVQDVGRQGFQEYGVIVGGVMDTVAYRIGNALLQQENEAAIEMTLTGGTFKFTLPTTIALTGGQMEVTLNGKAMPMNKAIVIRARDTLACGSIRGGIRSYLCIRGGIDVPIVMGSRSTYLKAGLGGFEGRALKAGDQIPYDESKPLKQTKHVHVAGFYEEGPIRVLAGTEWSRFTKELQAAFLGNTYEISLQADRMGYRLLPHTPIDIFDPFQIISEAVTFGTVQMPPNGEPIILMADCQTTGGYPKIAQVIAADLHRLAQLGPTQKVQFKLVTVAEAEQSLERLEKEIRSLQLILK